MSSRDHGEHWKHTQVNSLFVSTRLTTQDVSHSLNYSLNHLTLTTMKMTAMHLCITTFHCCINRAAFVLKHCELLYSSLFQTDRNQNVNTCQGSGEKVTLQIVTQEQEKRLLHKLLVITEL